jgi:antitoxin PrlF
MRATLTSKGQVTIPKEIRDAMGLEAGSMVDFVQRDGVVYLIPDDPVARIRLFLGALHEPGCTDEVLDELRGGVDLP